MQAWFEKYDLLLQITVQKLDFLEAINQATDSW